MSARKPKSKAKFIAIEGGEGSGKSSLMIALKEALGDAIITSREPGGSPYAEVIRQATLKNPLAKDAPPETTMCLMFAARFDHVKNLVKPALDAGTSVITDRFDGSSYAYNVWAQANGKLEDVFWYLRKRLATVPDLYIYVDVAIEEGMRRAHSRNQSLLKGQYDHFDDREKSFHTKVAEGYKKFLSHVPHIIIDGNQPLEEVKKDFISEIRKRLAA